MKTVAIRKIRKVKCNKEPVYDIAVPKYSNFVLSNGLVVHNCKPYQYLKNTIYEERIELPESDLMVEEFLGLERDSNGKINHPDGGSTGSKDMVDAICGSIYNASQNAEQYAFDYGETIDTIVQVSQDSVMSGTKQQVSVELEKELQALLNPMQKRQLQPTQVAADAKQKQEAAKFINKENTQKQNEYKHMDFGMGPAQVYKPAYLQSGIIYW